LKDCRLDVDPAELDRIGTELRDDPAVAADLRYQYSDVVSANLNLSGNVVLLERALQVLEATSGKYEEAR
jgi:hypothetical protein